MPFYVFKNLETGDKEDFFYNSDHVPKIGDVIKNAGAEYRRLPSFILDTAGIERKTHKYPYISRVLPRNINQCECNPKGQPIIKSQAHERSVASEHDMAKE